MFTIKNLTASLIAMTVSILTACTSISPTQSTLTRPHELKQADDGSKRYLKAPLTIQSEIFIADIAVKLQDGNRATLTSEDQIALSSELRNQLVASLGNAYKLVQTPSATSLTLHATITDVRTSSVVGNIVSTLLLFVPADKGGAAAEFELKATSGERVAAMSVATQGKFAQFEGAYSRLGQAKLALEAHAKSLAALLQGHDISHG
jgi:hypothetical protein